VTETSLIEITAIRLAGGSAHEHISDVRWRCKSTSSGQCTVEGLVAWLRADDANRAVLAESSHLVAVLVVDGVGGPCLRARDQGSWTDDLLFLPRF
jgi:hypothetical protein